MARTELSKTRVERAAAQVVMAKTHEDTQLATDAVLLLTGWSAPTLYRKCAAGEFPRNIAPGRWHGGQVLRHLSRAGAGASAK